MFKNQIFLFYDPITKFSRFPNFYMSIYSKNNLTKRLCGARGSFEMTHFSQPIRVLLWLPSTSEHDTNSSKWRILRPLIKILLSYKKRQFLRLLILKPKKVCRKRIRSDTIVWETIFFTICLIQLMESVL